MDEWVLQKLQHLQLEQHQLEKDLPRLLRDDLKAYQKSIAQYTRQQKFLDQFAQWESLQKEQSDLKTLADGDELMRLVEEDLLRISRQSLELQESLKQAFIPIDPQEECSCFLEIRAGTGGEEAAMFCADLLRMYQQYAQQKKYLFELQNRSESETGGLKAVTVKIEGQGAYKQLRHESGGHRVQRVPLTETQGRIHTSSCIVMVIPQAPVREDIVINTSDLRIDTFRASGAGGQHVNKTDSAVRITHLPTGVVATCQTCRSQHQNKDSAMEILRARLTAMHEEKLRHAETELRLSLLSSGRRTDRIRTYNFPQGRITDHRLPITLFNLEAVLAGDLDSLIGPIQNEYKLQKITASQQNDSRQK